MNDGEVIAQFFSILVDLTNQMKLHGKNIMEFQKVEKILRALHAKFNHIVVAIEESKYLFEMQFEELQAFLEVCELRLKHRNSEKVTEQALQTKN